MNKSYDSAKVLSCFNTLKGFIFPSDYIGSAGHREYLYCAPADLTLATMVFA